MSDGEKTMASVLQALLLIDRLAALMQGLGATVRKAIRENRPVSDDDLEAQSQAVADAIADARADIAARRPGA